MATFRRSSDESNRHCPRACMRQQGGKLLTMFVDAAGINPHDNQVSQ